LTEPLITVIVPIYNVERYLGPCIDSILAQTYENLEILLLDDGSADGSGTLCDEYREKDSRIRVIHKENTGQADTRNLGIDLAAGEYLACVDSDDLIAAEYIERLYQMAVSAGAGMSVCGFRPFADEGKSVLGPELLKKKGDSRHRAVRVMTACEALESLFYKKEITASPCYRLFHRDVFAGLRFEKGRIFEDIGLMYLAVEAAGKIACTSQVLYYYRQRKGSTMHHVQFTGRRLDRIWFSEKILEFAEKKYPRLLPAARSRFFTSCFLVLAELPRGKGYRDIYRMLRTNLKKYGRLVVRDPKASAKTRLTAALACFSVPAARLAGVILRRTTSMS